MYGTLWRKALEKRDVRSPAQGRPRGNLLRFLRGLDLGRKFGYDYNGWEYVLEGVSKGDVEVPGIRRCNVKEERLPHR